MRIPVVAAVLACIVLAAPSVAQSAPKRFKGTIETYTAATRDLRVKTDQGTTIDVTLDADAKVIGNQKSSLSDIKPGDFVASAARTGTDGKLHSEEVRIFPDALRGLGEGQYPMSGPNQSMTNATVEEVNGSVAAKSGVLKLTFHGSGKTSAGGCTGHATAPGKGTCTGQTELVVGPEVPVTRWIIGDQGWLKPGMAVSLFAMQAPDGKLTAKGVVVEHNGIKPL